MESTIEVGERILCPTCYSVNLHCTYCGEYTDNCACGEIDSAYCFACEEEVDITEQAETTGPYCHHWDAAARLVCDTCEVVRDSLDTDEWRWQEARPFCDCQPEAALDCKRCGVTRDHVHDQWEWESDLLYYSYKCRHYDHAVHFPNGTVVYASSVRQRESTEDAPDFGLYLDGAWTPDCLNYHLGWTDYGLPRRWELAVAMIVDTYRKAQDEQWVEVGCVGGHGRTGTALACMAVLSGVPADEAIDWVRVNYCAHAIETEEQEWWVDWFDCYVNGGTTAPKPLDQWLTKKEKKKAKKKGPETYTFSGFNWRDATIFTTDAGHKPQFEYGAVLSRSVKARKAPADEAAAEDIEELPPMDEEPF